MKPVARLRDEFFALDFRTGQERAKEAAAAWRKWRSALRNDPGVFDPQRIGGMNKADLLQQLERLRRRLAASENTDTLRHLARHVDELRWVAPDSLLETIAAFWIGSMTSSKIWLRRQRRWRRENEAGAMTDNPRHFIGKPCPCPGHGSIRFRSDGTCIVCARERVRTRRAAKRRAGNMNLKRFLGARAATVAALNTMCPIMAVSAASRKNRKSGASRRPRPQRWLEHRGRSAASRARHAGAGFASGLPANVSLAIAPDILPARGSATPDLSPP